MPGNRLRIAMLQDRPGSGIRDCYGRILRRAKPDIVSLPEYYFVNYDEDNVVASCSRKEEILSEIAGISTTHQCILVGGTIVEQIGGALFNRCYLLNTGRIVGRYDKIHPYDNEGRGLIKAGIEYRVFLVRGIRIGILICADVLYAASFANIRGLSPDLIFVPTTSPYRKSEGRKQKFNRDRKLFVVGARIAGCLIFKICASGRVGRHRLQGRSLIASPEKIEWRIDPEFEDRSALIIADVHNISGSHQLDITVHRE
jgi:predicted amidohydrolase